MLFRSSLMRIVIDLDGTICRIKSPEQSYAEVAPIPGAKERLREMRKKGHYIVIQSARNMATCDSNVGKVMKNIGKVTLEWLEKNGMEYDEIYFGKPNAELYIDDRAIRFTTWEELDEDTLKQKALKR